MRYKNYTLGVVLLILLHGCANSDVFNIEVDRETTAKKMVVFPFIGKGGESTYWSTDYSKERTFELKSREDTSPFYVNNGSHHPSSLYFRDFYYLFDSYQQSIFKSDGTKEGTERYKEIGIGYIDELFESHNQLCYGVNTQSYCMKNGEFILTDRVYNEPVVPNMVKDDKDILQSSLLYQNSAYYFLKKDGFVYKTSGNSLVKLSTEAILDSKILKKSRVKFLKLVGFKNLLYSLTTEEKEGSCSENGEIKSELYKIDLEENSTIKLKEVKTTLPLLLC